MHPQRSIIIPSLVTLVSRDSVVSQNSKQFFFWAINHLLVTFSTSVPLEPTSIVWPLMAHTAHWPRSPLLLAVLLRVIKVCSTYTAGVACIFECKPHNTNQFILLFNDYNKINMWYYCYCKYLFHSSSMSITSSLQSKRMLNAKRLCLCILSSELS